MRVQKLLRICRMLRALWKCMTARLRHSVALSAHTNHHDTIGISDNLQRPDLFPLFQKQIIEKRTPLVRPQGHYSKGDCLKHKQSIVSGNRWRRSLHLIWKRSLSAASARASEKKNKNFRRLAALSCKVSCFHLRNAQTKPTSLFFFLCRFRCDLLIFLSAGESEERAIKRMIAAKLGDARVCAAAFKSFPGSRAMFLSLWNTPLIFPARARAY